MTLGWTTTATVHNRRLSKQICVCTTVPYSLDCHRGAVLVFHKLCRVARSIGAHRTESVSVTGHELAAEVSSTGLLDQKQQNKTPVPRRSGVGYCKVSMCCKKQVQTILHHIRHLTVLDNLFTESSTLTAAEYLETEDGSESVHLRGCTAIFLVCSRIPYGAEPYTESHWHTRSLIRH